jgi:hypothetical protein
VTIELLLVEVTTRYRRACRIPAHRQSRVTPTVKPFLPTEEIERLIESTPTAG